MDRIDAHLHVNFFGFGPEQLIAYMDNNQIDKCWLLTWEEINPVFKDQYQNLGIDDVMRVYEEYPDRIVPFYAPDPGRKDLNDIMAYYRKKGVKGCGELKVSYRWLDEYVENLLVLLSQYEMPLVFHMEQERQRFHIPPQNKIHTLLNQLLNGGFNGLSRKYLEIFIDKTGFCQKIFQSKLEYFPGYMLDFAGLEHRLKQFPKVNFVAHGPEIWKHIEENPDPRIGFAKGKIKNKGIIVNLLEQYPNLYADISGKSGFNALSRDPGFTKDFLNSLYKKIIYGTDNFAKFSFESIIRRAQLAPHQIKRIMGENAEMLCK